ncbi:MAG: hypothetical protein M3401_10470 [Actinomycetota bacterium]|nr:hypothetical protein [Actinomycetota bacterium]
MTTRQAVVAVGTVLLLALTGCGPRAAGPSADGDKHPGSTTQAPSTAIDERGLPAAGRAALQYTLAARSWTASNHRAHYREQLALSTGSLRRALRRAPPTREQIAAYRADAARLEATALSATSLLDSPTQSRYRFVLDERSVAAGQTVQEHTTYLIELHRRGGHWLVTAFTVQP